MNAKFENDLEAGTLDADGHIVTKLQIYRRKYLEDKDWLIVGEIDYDIEYNVYTFIDRFAENESLYEYAIVPIAGSVIGDITISEPIKVSYDGVYISDLNNNFKLEIDLSKGAITHNTNMATYQPIGSQYPILSFGNQQYQSGTMAFLPLTEQQIVSGGKQINAKEEREYRNRVTNFLKNGSSKVIRTDSGEMMVVGVNNIQETPKDGWLQDLSEISFDFVEIGKINGETMVDAGLVGTPNKSKYTFDEFGNVEWDLTRQIMNNQLINRARNTLEVI